jgi:AcrR family transcriptional regulator
MSESANHRDPPSPRRDAKANPSAASTTTERLLEAALQAFAAKGYKATTVDEIGQAAGVTGPAIYRHFRGKEGLFSAVWQWAAGETISEAIEATKKMLPEDAADTLLRAHAYMTAHHPEWIRIWITARATLPADLHEVALEQENAYLTRWREVVAGLRPDLGRAEQHDLVGLARGAATASAWFGSDLPPERRQELAVDAGWAVLRLTAKRWGTSRRG